MLLDSTVLIDVLRGGEAVLRRLAALQPPFMTSVICVEEVEAEVRPGEEDLTAKLIESLEHASVDLDQARVAGVWRRRYRERGITLESADCLIAACAAAAGVPLATANVKRFPMPEVHVEHWPSE